MNTHSLSDMGAIVVGVDGSPLGEHAVLWAAEEAQLQRRGLTLVHAVKPMSTTTLGMLASAGIPPQQVNREANDHAMHVIERAHALAIDRFPTGHIETLVHLGDPRRILLELSDQASLTVVGTRGHGLAAGLMLGSVSGAVVRHASGPVAVVRPVPPEGRGVTLGVDGSEASLLPVELAFEQAAQRAVPLTVVHCLWDVLVRPGTWAYVTPTDPECEEARVRIAEALAGTREKFPDVEVDTLVTRGAAADCLVDLSQRCELMVIGRSGGWWSRGLAGGALTTVIAEHAHSPVIVAA